MIKQAIRMSYMESGKNQIKGKSPKRKECEKIMKEEKKATRESYGEALEKLGRKI